MLLIFFKFIIIDDHNNIISPPLPFNAGGSLRESKQRGSIKQDLHNIEMQILQHDKEEGRQLLPDDDDDHYEDEDEQDDIKRIESNTVKMIKMFQGREYVLLFCVITHCQL